MANKLLLPTVAIGVAVFSLAGILPAIAGNNSSMQLFGDNSTTSTNATGSSSMNATTTTTSTAPLIMANGTLDCKAIASELGGVGVPNGKVCDVVVVRQTPQITGDNGLNLNQFTLMNSVLEFYIVPANATTMSSSSNSSSSNMSDFSSSSVQNSSNGNSTDNNSTGTSSTEQVYVMGDFALLETEMNDVLAVVKDNGWTVTGIHNHMINETPKTSFMHWETQGDINTIISQANEAFTHTSIKG